MSIYHNVIARKIKLLAIKHASNPLARILVRPLYKALISNSYLKKQKRQYLRHSKEALLAAKKALESINAFFWVDFGTLLGVVRERDFLKHDMDIDISMFLSDYTPAVDKAMQACSFRKIYHVIINNSDNGMYGLEQKYDYNGLQLDIFFYTKKGEYMYTHALSNVEVDRKMTLLPIEQYLPNNGFTEIDFLETKFNIPNNVETYLSYHYGDDYMVPNKTWNYKDLERDNVHAKILYDKVVDIK